MINQIFIFTFCFLLLLLLKKTTTKEKTKNSKFKIFLADGHLDECGHHIRSGSGHDPPILGASSPEVVASVESR